MFRETTIKQVPTKLIKGPRAGGRRVTRAFAADVIHFPALGPLSSHCCSVWTARDIPTLPARGLL